MSALGRLGTAEIAAAAATPDRLRAETVDAAGYRALDEAVSDLIHRATEPNVFADPALVSAIAGASNARIVVALAWDGRRLAGALPVRIEGARPDRPLPHFSARLHGYAVLSTPLLDRDAAQPAWGALLDALRAAPRAPAVLALPFLGAGGPAFPALEAVAARTGRPLAILDRYDRARTNRQPGGAEAYAAARFPNKDKRKKWRQGYAKLEALGIVTVTRHGAHAVAPAFEEFLALEAGGWKGRAGTAIASSATDTDFMRAAVADLAEHGGAELFALRLDGRAIAMGLVLRSGPGAWFHKIAYDEALAQTRPGERLAHELSLALMDEPDLAFADSCALRGGGLLTSAWTDSQPIADVLVSLEPGGGIAFPLAVAAERARRAARAFAKTMWLRLKRGRGQATR